MIDIIIPVYNEGENIKETLYALKNNAKTPFRALILYDEDNDNTLPVVKKIMPALNFPVLCVKNRGAGVYEAIMTGFEAANAPAILVFPADESYNADIIDRMYNKFKEGADVVVASRFMKSGSIEGGPFLKTLIVRVASFLIHRIIGVPASDASYGLRLFSKKLLDTVLIESTAGFTYAIELLVKCHRLRWKIAEVPAVWRKRTKGKSRFNLARWLPHYARWFFYALATTCLRKTPGTVKLKTDENR